MGKHQLHEYPAAVLQALSPIIVLRLAGGGGVVGGGELGTVFPRHDVTAGKVRSIHHHRHSVSLPISLFIKMKKF